MMKNYARSMLISGVAVAVSASGATLATPAPTATSAPAASPSPAAGLSQAQLDALIKADLSTCDSPVPVVPSGSVRAFSPDRVARTLHGIWRGRVWGDYPPELIAPDGYLNVDYYWIIDALQGEALILEQLSSTRSAPPASANARAWSFLTCGREGYIPQHPKQVHEFQKISSTLEDARQILQTSTGLVVDDPVLSLSAVWQRLVDTRYFDTARFGAYAGGLFKPLSISSSTSAAGAPMLSLSYHAEYRGSGQTAARFETGVPILGQESGSFIGVSASSGDYLVSSAGNGVAWLKADAVGALIDMIMDKVVIGPLAQ